MIQWYKSIYIYIDKNHILIFYITLHISNDLIPIQILKRKFSSSCKKFSIVESDPDIRHQRSNSSPLKLQAAKRWLLLFLYFETYTIQLYHSPSTRRVFRNFYATLAIVNFYSCLRAFETAAGNSSRRNKEFTG